jgi:hypothetical protein
VAHLVPRHSNLLVTRTLSKAHSLAGFRVGYGIFPEAIADDLNNHNDAYPLARPSQAAAIATLQHEDKIRTRAGQLRAWTEELAAQIRTLGVRTFSTRTYFFLADFAPHRAVELADRLRSRDILIKPVNDPVLGPGYMRITTALPEDNRRFVDALRGLLSPTRRSPPESRKDGYCRGRHKRGASNPYELGGGVIRRVMPRPRNGPEGTSPDTSRERYRLRGTRVPRGRTQGVSSPRRERAPPDDGAATSGTERRAPDPDGFRSAGFPMTGRCRRKALTPRER